MWKRLLIILIFLNLTSCVYYNTFYNARQKFKEAERNQARSTNPNQPRRNDDVIHNRAGKPVAPSISINDKTLYKSAIEKANKVVLYHRKSKYMDDALWLIGKARYNMAEFVAADKNFRELIVHDPQSKYVDDAYYYIGMSQFWMNEYELALEAFSSVLSMKKSSYKDDAMFNIAYMDYLDGNFSSAIESFKKFLKDYSNSDSSASAQFFIAVSHDSLGEEVAALNAYRQIDRYKPSHELYFDAQYAFGSSALKADSIELGMSIFEKLSRKEKYFNKSSIIRIKFAEGMQRSGKTEDAIKEYLEVAEQFPKTEESAEAYYRLGLIYQNDIFDLEKAKEYFNKATQEKRDSEFRNLALAKSAQISKLETYRSKLGLKSGSSSESDSAAVDSSETVKESGQADSLTIIEQITAAGSDSTAPVDSAETAGRESMGPAFQAMLDRAGFEGKPDIPGEIGAGRDSLPIEIPGPPDSINGQMNADNPDTASIDMALADTSTVNEDVEIRFLLAELYHHDLNRPDSALNEYLLLAETYPESEYAPRALLASAFIYEAKKDTTNARKIYEKIIANYPSSSQARYSSAQIETPIPEQYDMLSLYNKAEEQYFVYNNPQAAITIFEYIEKTFPESEFAAKSAYARAWILSETQQVDGDSSSYLAFSEIVENYPESKYAEGAKVAMGLVKRVKDEPKKPEHQRNPRQPGAESDTSRVEAVDSLFGGLPMAPPVLDSVPFVYPESLLNARREEKGKVIFKIRLDLFGNITQYEMLGPSGSDLIDSVAVQTLRQTTFDMSYLEDLTLLDGYFRYDIRFEPPRDWEDRYEHADPFDPYNDQRGGGP